MFEFLSRRPSVALAFWITVLAPACAASDPVEYEVQPVAFATARDNLDREIPALLERHDVPAVGVAVATSRGVVFSATYGEARPGETATVTTMFNIASVTKLLTAETVLRAAGDGVVSLDEPMRPLYVDPDVASDPRSEILTARHALAHQSGFPNWRYQAENERLAFEFEPGSRPGYSGEGYDYVARYLEAATGEAFPDRVRSQVLVPEGALSIAFNAKTSLSDTFAWSRGADGTFRTSAVQTEWSAADDAYASPTAFARVLASMLRADALPAHLEADRRTIQFDMTEMFCARPSFEDICPRAVGFGLSGIVFAYENETVLWQGGGDDGERAIAFYVPERDLAVVVFTNGSAGGRLMAPIIREFYDNPDFIRFLEIQGEEG